MKSIWWTIAMLVLAGICLAFGFGGSGEHIAKFFHA